MNSIDTISQRWREEGLNYVTGINDYVRRGMSLGWDKAGKEPEDTRSDLATDVLNFIRQANETGKIEHLRKKFPPAYAPFLEMLNENDQHLGPLALLDDDRIMIRAEAPYQEGKVYIIDDLKIEELRGIITFGRSPNRKYFALARESGIDVHEGWDGPKVATIQWSTGLKGAPSESKMEPIKGVPPITQLLPFPDGERVLLISSDGIFVLSVDGAIRLHPGTENLRDHFGVVQKQLRILDRFFPVESTKLFLDSFFNWLKKERSDDFNMGIDMEHGAISPDGKLIAIGSQDSNHLVFNEAYELVGDIGPLSSYPHYTVFSEDGKLLACNSCHFYNGATIGQFQENK